MKKLIIILIAFVMAVPLMARAPYAGATVLATSDSVGTTAAETLAINLDTYRGYTNDADLVNNTRIYYKFVSTAGTPSMSMVLQLSIDNSNWVYSYALQDSLKTEDWVVDTFPTNANFFKYGRIIWTGITGNNADVAIWSAITFVHNK